MRINSLELALESLKIKNNSEIERLNMIIADYESKQMRTDMSNEENEENLSSILDGNYYSREDRLKF